MKIVIVTAVFSLFSIGMLAQEISNTLPSAAQDFIQQYFASVSIEEVKETSKWKIWEDDKFEIKLSNGVELDFDKDGNIKEIESENGEAIPLKALPSNIGSYLESNYPDAIVIGWEKHRNEQEVELADGTDLEFDEEGNFKKNE